MAVLFFWGEMEYGLRLRSVAAGVSFEDLSGFFINIAALLSGKF